MNRFIPFSKKQLAVLNWWCNGSDVKNKNGIICDGAVRSGKTLCMGISFICWSFYAFCDTSFAICGKTISSLRRNVITPLLPTLKELGFSVDYRISRNMVTISRGNVTNRYYLFGGRDESSASLIQGMTLGGVMLDEVALMPRSFVEQAVARCSLENSKYFFNCNPEHGDSAQVRLSRASLSLVLYGMDKKSQRKKCFVYPFHYGRQSLFVRKR